MRVFSISVVRNEKDVIEAFVRHNAQWFERMTVICHLCSDHTEDILQKLKEEGFPLDIRHSDAAYHAQADVQTQYVQKLRESGDAPDWLFFLDADEFLMGDPMKLDPTALALIPWRTYVPMPDDDQSQKNPLKRIRHHRTMDPVSLCKIAIPRTLLIDQMLAIQPGNHGALLPNKKWPVHAWTTAMYIAHFPVRSSKQIAAKAQRGWSSVSANPNRTQREAFHWHAMADSFASKGEPDPEALKKIALRYSLDDDMPDPAIVLNPFPCSFELKYSGDATLQDVPSYG